jgi:feruloyl esterase
MLYPKMRYLLFASLSILTLPVVRAFAPRWEDACAALKYRRFEDTTITNTFYQPAGTNVSETFDCYRNNVTFTTYSSVCRVQGHIKTSEHSSLSFEAWLPDTWHGRFISLGNAGLGGCPFSCLVSGG